MKKRRGEEKKKRRRENNKRKIHVTPLKRERREKERGREERDLEIVGQRNLFFLWLVFFYLKNQ